MGIDLTPHQTNIAIRRHWLTKYSQITARKVWGKPWSPILMAITADSEGRQKPRGYGHAISGEDKQLPRCKDFKSWPVPMVQHRRASFVNFCLVIAAPSWARTGREGKSNSNNICKLTSAGVNMCIFSPWIISSIPWNCHDRSWIWQNTKLEPKHIQASNHSNQF